MAAQPGKGTKHTVHLGLCPCGGPENLSGLDLGSAQHSAPTWDSASHPFHPTSVQPFHGAPQIRKRASNHILREEEKAFPHADAEWLVEIPWSLLLLQTMTAAHPHGRWLAEWPLHLSKVRGSILSFSKHGVWTRNISITRELERHTETWSPHTNLLKRHLHFNKIPRRVTRTLRCEKH